MARKNFSPRQKRRVRRFTPLGLESLEQRQMLAADWNAYQEPLAWPASTDLTCKCCAARVQQAPAVLPGPADLPAAALLPDLSSSKAPLPPQLSSNAGAVAKLFLDFNGHFEATWLGNTNIATPPFDQDGDPTSFSSIELSSIEEIWSRVAEDYAPFHIDVTTLDPGSVADRSLAVIAVGGSYSDWYGFESAGLAFTGGFTNFAPNVGFVFSTSLGNHPGHVAAVTAHEAGHLFGLQHQSTWNGNNLVEEYNSGNGSWAPIMGTSFSAARTTWHNGPSRFGPTFVQDDMAILGGTTNGFGFRSDDFGDSMSSASVLPRNGAEVQFTGLIGQSNDVDAWSFQTTGGQVTFQLAGSRYGSNLDATLELWNRNGNVLVRSAPESSFGAEILLDVAPGDYFLVAKSGGDYGNVGQYTITGTIGTATPEIAIRLAAANVQSGQLIDLGNTVVGTPLVAKFIIQNEGTATLKLSSLSQDGLPTGFSLVEAFQAESVPPGQSTSFSIRLDALQAGQFAGWIVLDNNDQDESVFSLNLSGRVVGPRPDLVVLDEGRAIPSGAMIDLGSTVTGTVLQRSLVIRNDGSMTLVLTPLQAASLPPGLTIAQNLTNTVLAPGQSSSLILRLEALRPGVVDYSATLVSNDPEESPFILRIRGAVQAPVPDSRKTIDDGNAGNTLVGKWSRHQFAGYGRDQRTAKKGNGALQSKWNFKGLPAGYYQIWTTWIPAPGNATNAPFYLSDGSVRRSLTRVNQRLAPSSLDSEGAYWQLLGTVQVKSGVLLVRLTNSANGKVVADAVRVNNVSAPPASMRLPSDSDQPPTAVAADTGRSSAEQVGGQRTAGSPQSQIRSNSPNNALVALFMASTEEQQSFTGGYDSEGDHELLTERQDLTTAIDLLIEESGDPLDWGGILPELDPIWARG